VGEYPPDIRVGKEIQMLRDGGHECCLLCLSADKRGDQVLDNGLPVRYVPRAPQNIVVHKLNLSFFYLSFLNVHARRHCVEFIRDFSPEVLHVHGLPLMATACEVARLRGIPVVADLHENYPAALQEWYGSPLKKATIHNFRRWTRYEGRVLSKASHILVVVDESKELLLEHGLPEDKISIVPNVSSPDFLNLPVDERILSRLAGRFVISYIGGFGPHRGVDTAIRAMRMLKAVIPSARLLLVGTAPKGYLPELEGLVTACGVQDVVEFTGWRPFEEVPSYIQASDICLVPHNLGVQTNASGPHKLFQYWMMRKPVIVSSCKSLKRMVESVKGGLVFEAENPQSLADCVLSLYRDSELRQSLGTNGQQAVLTGEFSWERASTSLNAVYARLAERI